MALARACYADADTYLLDDPLSAVDAAVGAHIFQKCIQGLLAGKTRVLATHQLQYLPGADLVMVLERGAVQNLGRWADVTLTDLCCLCCSCCLQGALIILRLAVIMASRSSARGPHHQGRASFERAEQGCQLTHQLQCLPRRLCDTRLLPGCHNSFAAC